MASNPFNHSNLIMILFGVGASAITWFALSFFDAKTEIAVVKSNLENVGKENGKLESTLNALATDMKLLSNNLSTLTESNRIMMKKLQLATSAPKLQGISHETIWGMPMHVNATYTNALQEMEFLKQEDGTWIWATGEESGGIKVLMAPTDTGSMKFELLDPDTSAKGG